MRPAPLRQLSLTLSASSRRNKRYAGLTGYDIKSCAAKVKEDFGKVDILVHSLANGPEVTRPLLETTRNGCALLPSSPALPYTASALH